ncbi:MAG: fasciclin domain-containing protein [Planctomycetota bacterium]
MPRPSTRRARSPSSPRPTTPSPSCAGTVETLLKPENKDQLAAILKHHVVSGRVYADMAAKLDKAPTLNGTELPIAITKESARIGNANIVSTDIEANNGVIHVIDTVLLP